MDEHEMRGAKRSKGRDFHWRPVGLDCEKAKQAERPKGGRKWS